MPFDDTDVKKMIKYQTERKVGFSRHKKISAEVKELIHGILEARTDERFSISNVRQSTWMTTHTDDCIQPSATTTTTTSTTTTATRDDQISSADGGQQSDSVESGPVGRVRVVERDRLVEQSEHRASISVNNNNDTVSKLHRPRSTRIPTPPVCSVPFRARTCGR